ncbi:sarcospan-like isoform X1 [Ornithodoros turicata]|uniref:sarcospan-like isoform X1 n=1 Tax=Ornithodoros turicata TaxID=34597 RepID=UPI003139183B
MRCPGIALALTVAQLATGLGLTALCVHLMLKLPSLTTRDWPVWAAGPLITAGIVGVMTVYSAKHYKTTPNRKPIFVLKVVSFVLSSLSMVLCMVAAAFLVLHVLLYIDRYSECRYDLRGHQCFCTLPSHSQLYRYSNVTCLQVGGSIKGLFYTTAAVSVVAGISCLWYLAILWSSRYVYFYSGVAQVKSIPQVLEQYSTQQHST